MPHKSSGGRNHSSVSRDHSASRDSSPTRDSNTKQQQQQQQQPLSQVASALKGVEFIAQHIKKADKDTEVRTEKSRDQDFKETFLYYHHQCEFNTQMLVGRERVTRPNGFLDDDDINDNNNNL